ncbi:LCP family protein [Pseudoclavibacter sp. CFCC 11306]|uniref:LCP family protein n=1 Tax=Pseudoclavibacter sp. CFCC 11306 TaxID=1564493 RepID=UPI001300FE23|nr:LCP family protein [Pseudoclavibacter sp. CFCC 11306]KAB1657477.1 LytR family transcriptional regulator [Pseudoclavibacter sp. CFCC 11306]
MAQSRRERREVERRLAKASSAANDNRFTAVARHGALAPAGGGPKAIFKWLALCVTMVIVGGIALAGLMVWSVQKDIGYFDFTNVDGSPQVATVDGPVNFLLIGSDTRKDQGEGFTAEDKDADLADVIMLLHVSADHQTATAVSFPRDLMVSMPACPKTDGTGGTYPAQSRVQINSTISYGGPSCTALTIEKLTGVDIGFVGKIDFKGVIEMSNAIGGVPVCVTNDINDNDSGLHLTAGEHTIQGSDALAFLRNRHGVGDGSDLGRISSQQVYLSSLVRTIQTQGALTNPVRLYDLASAAARNMEFSSNLKDTGMLVSLGATAAGISLDNVAFVQAPVTEDPRDRNRVVLDPTLSTPLFQAIASGEGVRLNENSKTGIGSETVGEAPDAAASQPADAAPSTSAQPSPASGSPAPDASQPATVLPEGIVGQTARDQTCAVANR